MNRVLNIDWLEVFCLEPLDDTTRDASFYENDGWRVLRRDYGTRVYREMFTLCDVRGYSFLEVRRNPFSADDGSGGILAPNACHIRLTNYACYTENPIGRLREFLDRYHFTLVRIYRIDICLDFEKFDFGDDPGKFIRRYMEGRYSKMNQSNINAHGSDTWERRVWNSLSWGARKSMVGAKLYDKTKELAEAKDKPYIRWAWFRGGLVDDPNTLEKCAKDGTTYKPSIYRLEFSITAAAKGWFVIDRCDTRKATKIFRPHTLSMYDNRTKLLECFAALVNHYFRFKIYEPGTRKDRCKDKRIFEFSYNDTLMTIGRQVSEKVPKTFRNRLLALLRQYEGQTFDTELKTASRALIRSLESQQEATLFGEGFTREEILTMQRLIAERVNRPENDHEKPGKTEIEQLIMSTEGLIF